VTQTTTVYLFCTLYNVSIKFHDTIITLSNEHQHLMFLFHNQSLVGSVVIDTELGRGITVQSPATMIRRGLESLDARTNS
jgi:hypothetical protein